MSTHTTIKSEKMPAKFLKQAIELAEVPRAEYMPAPRCENPQDESKRRSFFGLLKKSAPEQKVMPNTRNLSLVLNSALWMRVFAQDQQLISFFLLYGDESGHHAILVDEAMVSADQSSVMFTNNIAIQARGELEYIKVACTGLLPGKYIVDELFVQQVKQASDPQRKSA